MNLESNCLDRPTGTTAVSHSIVLRWQMHFGRMGACRKFFGTIHWMADQHVASIPISDSTSGLLHLEITIEEITNLSIAS